MDNRDLHLKIKDFDSKTLFRERQSLFMALTYGLFLSL